MDLEVALGMSAGGADLRSGSSYHDMSAVTALPNLDLALLEYLSGLNVVKKRAVSFLVRLLNSGYKAEFSCELVESLFLSGLCKARVHISPLIVLTVSGRGEVLCGVADALKLLEPKLCVLLLILSGLQKQGRDLLKAFLLCLGSKIGTQ